jgi:regulator of protease activity HflC (stomatin/prohibitin superfamily)
MALIYTIPQNHCVIIERFGKFSSVQSEGLNFKIPFLDTVKYVNNWRGQAVKQDCFIELSEQKTDTPARQCQTKDNVTVQADASVYWKIIDPVKAVYNVDILPTSISDIALNALRANIGTITLDQVLSERQHLNEKIATQLAETASKWGIAFTRVEIQELKYSEDTAQAMMQEMDAERKRRAKVSEAEGEAFAITKKAESEAKATLIRAEAQSNALKMITDAEINYLTQLKSSTDSHTAGQILIAQKFIEGFDAITKNASDKVFLPNSFHGLFNLPTHSNGNGKSPNN